MNQRERSLLTVLLAILGLGGGAILVYKAFVVPLQTAHKTLAALRDEVDTRDLQLLTILKEKRKLDSWRILGLHSNVSKASHQYARYLNEVFKNSGLTVDDMHGPPTDLKETRAAAKKSAHTTLTFTIHAHGEVAQLAKFLFDFQRAALPQRLRSLNLDRPEGTAAKQAGSRIGMKMVIEVLVVQGRDAQAEHWPSPEVVDTLVAMARGPVGFPVVPWALGVPGPRGQRLLGQTLPSRNYADLSRRNPFVGALPPPPPPPPPTPIPMPVVEEGPDMREFVRLVSITLADRKTQTYRNQEAFLRNFLVKTNDIRLCGAPRSGYDSFRIYNEEGSRVILRGKVLRIDSRDVYFQVDGEVYGIHIGQTLAEAMRRSLADEQIQELGLTVLEEEEAAASKEKKEMEKKGRTR